MCGSPSDCCDLWEVKNYLILRATRNSPFPVLHHCFHSHNLKPENGTIAWQAGTQVLAGMTVQLLLLTAQKDVNENSRGDIHKREQWYTSHVWHDSNQKVHVQLATNLPSESSLPILQVSGPWSHLPTWMGWLSLYGMLGRKGRVFTVWRQVVPYSSGYHVSFTVTRNVTLTTLLALAMIPIATNQENTSRMLQCDYWGHSSFVPLLLTLIPCTLLLFLPATQPVQKRNRGTDILQSSIVVCLPNFKLFHDIHKLVVLVDE